MFTANKFFAFVKPKKHMCAEAGARIIFQNRFICVLVWLVVLAMCPYRRRWPDDQCHPPSSIFFDVKHTSDVMHSVRSLLSQS